ncbi:hypothetical protein QAD02_014676 [Eretmocerus hayati]|uniref:Uncharacterized protein n=1 Tax=Eretmocerus hayati TaxID=131215 RepID=A0ACC2P8G2_9HYME|nr:hypothetical protein QAD02_014676 [Eretmocerus hayati]
MTLFSLIVLLTSIVNLAVGFDEYVGSRAICKEVQWSGGNSFKWPSATTKQLYKNGKMFVSKNVLATRFAVYKDEAYVAMPRFKSGIPFTLGILNLRSKGCLANIFPYPSWELHEEGECAAFQNVVDVFLDEYDTLWTLDTGIVNHLETPIRRCPPKVVAFDLKKKKLIKNIDMSQLGTNSSRLQHLVVENNPDDRTYIYVSDAADRAILVFDVSSGRGYRVILPKAVSLGCATRDVLSMALIHCPLSNENNLLFSYLSGKHLFTVSTRHLRNGSAVRGKITDLGIKKNKLVFLGTGNGSALYFRNEGESDVYRWDLSNGFDDPSDFEKVYKGRRCELATHVVPDYKRGRMRVLESSYPDYFHGTVGCGATHTLTVF